MVRVIILISLTIYKLEYIYINFFSNSTILLLLKKLVHWKLYGVFTVTVFNVGIETPWIYSAVQI